MNGSTGPTSGSTSRPVNSPRPVYPLKLCRRVPVPRSGLRMNSNPGRTPVAGALRPGEPRCRCYRRARTYNNYLHSNYCRSRLPGGCPYGWGLLVPVRRQHLFFYLVLFRRIRVIFCIFSLVGLSHSTAIKTERTGVSPTAGYLLP